SSLPISRKTRAGLSLFLLLVAIAWFWQPLVTLYSLSQAERHYSHFVLIPFVSAFSFYLNRKSFLALKEWSPLPGVILLALGAFGYQQIDSLANGSSDLPLAIIAFVLTCWGIFLFFYGIKSFRVFSFGLLFLLCMVPFPAGVLHAIIVFLQRSAAEVTGMAFSLLGVPVLRDDIVFGLSNITIRIDEGCSAIRSALSLIITSIVAGHFSLRSLWAKLGVAVLMIPVAIVDNALRIVGLSLLANHVDKSFLKDGRLHDGGGYVMLALSMTILLVLISLLRRWERQPSSYASLHSKVASDLSAANQHL
ncbi:MAG TPA: exosortase/archaeosortase family protein, partial [Candidatus Saccharimonadales bacterium]|nr:exosortase/archaeosortase family protein [Candidatus Saccharimonadales bacterium]